MPSWLTEQVITSAGAEVIAEANVAVDTAVPPEPVFELPLVDRYIPPVPTARTTLPFALQLILENILAGP